MRRAGVEEETVRVNNPADSETMRSDKVSGAGWRKPDNPRVIHDTRAWSRKNRHALGIHGTDASVSHNH